MRGQLSVEVLGVVALVLAVHTATLAYVHYLGLDASNELRIESCELECRKLTGGVSTVSGSGALSSTEFTPAYDTEVGGGVAVFSGEWGEFPCYLGVGVGNASLTGGENYVLENDGETVRFR